MQDPEIVDAVWWELKDYPRHQLPPASDPPPDARRASARLAQSVALGDIARGRRYGGRMVTRPTLALISLPRTLTERARAVERQYLASILGRPLRTCPPLRSI